MSNLIKANQIKPTGVVLTQKQFDTVKGYLESYAKQNLVMNIATQEFSSNNPLYEIPFEDLLIAIYRPEDITIEQTIEEQLLELHEEACRNRMCATSEKDAEFWYGKECGLRNTLDIIGMKVKGINE
jgi:hypothetical protein